MPFGWLSPKVVGAAWVGKTAVVAGVAALSLAAVVGIASVSDAGEGGTDAVSERPPAAAPTPTPEATAEPDDGRPPREPEDGWLLPFDGVSAEAQPPSSATREVALPDPQSPFPPFDPPRDGVPTVLYDFETGEVRDYGPGSVAVFTDDGRFAVWSRHSDAGGTVTVLDLATGEQRELGRGEVYPWRALVGPSEVLVARGPEFLVTDAVTGAERELDAAWPDQRASPDWVVWDEFVLEHGEAVGRVDSPDGYQGIHRHELWRPGGDAPLVEFDATAVAYAGNGEFVLAAPAAEEDGRWTSNLYLIGIATGEAEFIATAEIVLTLPIAANERYVAWNERHAWRTPHDRPALRIYDRESGEITEIHTRFSVGRLEGTLLGLAYRFLPGSGVDAWFDLETMEWRQAAPPGGAVTQWSPDRRYASHGYIGGP